MKLARAFACALLLAALTACGTSPTGPAHATDPPQHQGATHHGSGG